MVEIWVDLICLCRHLVKFNLWILFVWYTGGEKSIDLIISFGRAVHLFGGPVLHENLLGMIRYSHAFLYTQSDFSGLIINAISPGSFKLSFGWFTLKSFNRPKFDLLKFGCKLVKMPSIRKDCIVALVPEFEEADDAPNHG
jgi:hypothetical protein